MANIDQIAVGAILRGIGDANVEVLHVEHDDELVTLVYRNTDTGRPDQRTLTQEDAASLEVVDKARQWSFDADGSTFKLGAEARRITDAYLYDPQLAVHLSTVDPLPHQLAAVYSEMLPRQPLRFLLADDPGAGKTIMAGLLIRELWLRGDLERCLIVVPANLAEQWQDELDEKFELPFDFIGREMLDTASSRKPLNEQPLLIGRIDLLKQDEWLDHLREAEEWDLVVIDEAHKMSARYSGADIRRTARYRLGEMLGHRTRHLLLMTATPHSGKDDDFLLFMSLLDEDRFTGRQRSSRNGDRVDVSDIMRRVLKEDLHDFDGEPLFPDRRATTVNYDLSPDESKLYDRVTRYVTDQMTRADLLTAVKNGSQRKTVVGFALTTLQRRLASSPAAIHQSLRRRHARLRKRRDEVQELKQEAELREGQLELGFDIRNEEELEVDLEERTEEEVNQIVDFATAAQTVEELEAEIASLADLEKLAEQVRLAGVDRKWEQLRQVLEYPEMFGDRGNRHKLVVFSEHRDTLDYLVERIANELGDEAVVAIHGGMRREARREAQERFLRQPEVTILVATDAAGEGVNLQRAHLMVNYDLPWNPNRIEQRFGRIHRFKQRNTCYLWNLVAHETREGAVYEQLLTKLEHEREALGGKVFDVLGQALTEVSLRELMIQAIRHNEGPDKRAAAKRQVDAAWNPDLLRKIVRDRALHQTTIETAQLQDLQRELERAQARRLIPHYIERFFLDAFSHFNGSIRRREGGRYEIRNVPQMLRRRTSRSRHSRLQPVVRSYERICFDKERRTLDDRPSSPEADLVAPGHPLLQSVCEQLLEAHGDVLRQGTMLVDDRDDAPTLRVLFAVETAVECGALDSAGRRRVLAKQVDYVSLEFPDSEPSGGGIAPYLDFRPLQDDEVQPSKELRSGPWAKWIGPDLERTASRYAQRNLSLRTYRLTRERLEAQIDKTEDAIRERLNTEIRYWRHRADELRAEERKGKTPRLNSDNADRRADDLEVRRDRRLGELRRERDISMVPPRVTGGFLVASARVLAEPTKAEQSPDADAERRRQTEHIAMDAVAAHERSLGNTPRDVSAESCGYDIESETPDGSLRMIEVKGRRAGADTFVLTRNEFLTWSNTGQDDGPDYLLAHVTVADGPEGPAATELRLFDSVDEVIDEGLHQIQLNLSKLNPRARITLEGASA